MGIKINSTMKILFRHTRVFTFLLTLLLLGSAASQAWAIKAYYHILTLPINTTDGYNTYHLNVDFNGFRLEALRVMVDNAQIVELPAAYKSPLATNFKYYYDDGTNVTKEAAIEMYNFSTKNKSRRYAIAGAAVATTEKTPISSTKDVHIYVTYEYDATKGVKLDGTENYNIPMSGGFLALNRGRNNRIAVFRKDLGIVSAKDLVSADFVQYEYKNDKIPGTNIASYWNGNQNTRDEVAGQYHFLFKFEGSDPYNILIGTAYDKNDTYIESHNSEPMVYKWYKGSHLLRPTDDGNFFMASDDHKQYTTPANKNAAGKYPKPNPTTDIASTPMTGYFHNKGTSLVYNTFAILNNNSESGYIFMVSRFINDKGDLSDPSDYRSASYNYLIRDDNYNNLTYKSITLSEASSKYSTDKKIYPIRDVNFKVKTPFYALADEEDKADHIVTAAAELSQYTIDNDDIDASFIPDELKRKYCTFTTFRNSAGDVITKYADAYNSTTGGYDVYVDYNVDASIPFKAITPKSTYTAAELAGASWYELTDDGSTEESGKKIVYVGGNFQNNGTSGTYNKTSEYAFIGDPYELQVISRSQTSGGTPSYVGAAETTAGIAFTANTSATAGYVWEMPYDATAGSFRLRKFTTDSNGDGYWSWNTGNASIDVTYGTTPVAGPTLTSNPQTLTLNVSNLATTYGNHLVVEASGDDSGQVGTITVGDILSDGTATITVAINANSNTSKNFTLTITEKNEGGSPVGTATVVTITQGTTAYAGGNVQYNTTATRVKVLPLPTRTFTYKIIDKSGRIAVKASAVQTIFSPLSLASIPSIIVSPFLQGETVTFYDEYSDRNTDHNLSRLDFHNPSEQTAITETPNVNHDIFVTYTTSSLDTKPIKLSEEQEFNVMLNGRYIYYDSSSGSIKSTETLDKSSKNFFWKLRNHDPYNMLIDNVGARTSSDKEDVTVYGNNGTSSTESREKGAWVKLAAALGNNVELAFTINRADAQKFIAKSSTQNGVYEVMVASGGGDGDPDASTTYYNIGRSSTTDIKIYGNALYAHGDYELRFQLYQSEDYQYHLIDMAKHELLTLTSQSAELVLPAEYQSPLVAEYSYYARDQITIDGKGTSSQSDDEYTPTDPAVKLTALTQLDAVFTTDADDIDATTWEGASTNYKKTATDLSDMEKQAKRLTEATDYYFKINDGASYKKVKVSQAFRGLNIYVTYTVNDRVKYNDNASPYLLKFLDPHPEGYYLEDGSDKLIPYDTGKPNNGKIQAVYPYTNGDGNLNIYGEAMNKEQMDGGANTRPRWVWFFESENSDPYHVMIHSRSTISYNDISHPTYLQTYAVKFKQDEVAASKHIVTGGALPTISSEDPTEYMVLGTDGHFKLRTTNLIEGARQDVKSLEQYWKTYNMIKLYVLGIDPKTDENYKDKFDNNESTWVVPDALRETLQTRLGALNIGSGQWHSYDAYANATRWNGYNDKTDGHEKKVVERLEHWYQTFDMGDGTFDIESADIPPVLVLLDRHGWEIMRKPLPKLSTYPNGEEELAALRAYDSPMVKEYKFYSNATKATGCHKYSLRMQNGAERDQIMDGGKHYTSTSLGSLPPIEATGVNIDGVLQDQYVTYTVKDEYEDSYTYNFVDHGNGSFTESGTASKFLMVQNGRFYKNRNDAAENRKSYISKPIFEHTFPEGGNVYDLIIAPHANNNINIVADDNKISDYCVWYVGPNLDIDKEMGIKYAAEAGSSGEPWTEYETKKNYFETGKGGFDPYNIQLENIGEQKFLTSHMTKTILRDGAMVGTYNSSIDSETTRITLETKDTSYPADATVSTGSEGYDHTNIAMTNQTFMAVSDANGNMQLMPRFDHTKRINVPTTAPNNDPWPTTLEDPVDYNGEAKVDDNSKMGPQTTFFVRPQRFVYRIIDNDGNEALRYKRAGDYYPTITEHFMSPLATNFKFYYDHAAYTASVSNEAAYTAAATSTAFQKTATNEADVTSQAKVLTVLGEYYFKIGAGTTESPYTYKKVTVTKAYVASPKADATYTTADCTETDWTHAEVKSRPEVADLATFQTAVDDLTETGTHFYKIGPFSGTCIYKKVVVKSGKSNFLADVAAKRDVSDKDVTGKALAEFDFDGDECEVFVRYSYNASADQDGDKILQGKWFTIKLDNKDVVASGTLVTTPPESEGTGVSLFTGDKPATTPTDNLKDAHQWHWKFLAAPIDPSSVLHESPDPYAIKIFNREKNYTTDLNPNNNPMAVGIKVDGHDRFSLLSHPSGGYALAVNGLGTFTYDFLNGAGMTTDAAATTATETNYQRTIANYDTFDSGTYFKGLPDGVYYFRMYDINKNVSYKKFSVTGGNPSTEGEASSEEEWNNAYHFTIKSSALSPATQLVFNNDITHSYVYHVINNGGGEYAIANPGYLAVTAIQDDATASSNGYVPSLPEAAQTPLLNMDDYLYYGSATPSADKYTVATQTKLFTLYGLYRDEVYVRYNQYDMNKTPFKVPNKRNATSEPDVARDPGSHDAAMNINGKLPYNIIWAGDYITKAVDTSDPLDGTYDDIGYDLNHQLDGADPFVWLFEGNDPYNLKIRHKNSEKYIYNSAGTSCTLDKSNSTPFMLLKKSGYDYGVLAKTGAKRYVLSGYGNSLADIEAATPEIPTHFIIFALSSGKLIYHLIIAKTCTKAEETDPNLDQSKYVDIPYRTEESGAETKKRIFGSTQRDLTTKNTKEGISGEKYQLGSTLSWGGNDHTYSYDAESVSMGDNFKVPSVFYRPNCTFDFYIEGIYNETGTTSESTLDEKYKGLKLDNLMSDANLIGKTVVVNIVYSFDKTLATNSGLGFVRNTEQNLWYTFETQQASEPWLARYTNTQKLSAIAGRATRYTNDYLFTPVGDVYGFKMYNRYVLKNSSDSGDDKTRLMTTNSLDAGTELDIVAPGSTGYEVYELLTGDVDGYFRVHPVVDIDDGDPLTAYNPVYVNIADNKLKLSTTPRDWTYGLDIAMLQPYYLGAGNVGGLTTTIKAGSGKSKSGKALYEDAVATGKITEIQNVVYDDKNIVDFATGYYRLHSQPGISDISPVRYASGYLHEIEKTAVSDGIPMHFYSKSGVNGTFNGDLNPLKTGFTETAATRGDIPVPSTETDPSTIFYVVNGDAITNRTISNVTMSTQGLNVIQNKMGTDEATPYRLIDIGGGVVVLVNTSGTNYLNFTQTGNIYDLKFSNANESRMDDVKWCMEPANNMGLKISTNNGGDGHYYATFYAPYDVMLPDNAAAFTCDKWNDNGLHPTKVPGSDGKFIPAETPVIIRTTDESGNLTLTLPNSGPTSSSITNIFTGSYLEKKLGNGSDVYTLGLPFDSDVHKDESDYATTGDIVAPLPHQANSGLGFYINATPNKENNELKARWDRNNRYVLHNKIYYRATNAGTRGPEFVPLLFEAAATDVQGVKDYSEGMLRPGNVYNLQGRCVATEEMVKDGTWKNNLTPGVYIMNGKKIIVK